MARETSDDDDLHPLRHDDSAASRLHHVRLL
jgi:hypothetical protein